MKMDKWLTLLTNAAVIASLLFLALELRQNNELMQLEARNAMSDARRELVLANMNNDKLILARRKAELGEELSWEEQRRITMYFFAVFRNWQDHFFSFQSGAYTEQQMASEAQSWHRSIRNAEHILLEWEQQKAEFAPAFVDYIEAGL